MEAHQPAAVNKSPDGSYAVNATPARSPDHCEQNAYLKSPDGFSWVSLFKGLGFAKLRCKNNPLKAAVAVSPTEDAADAAALVDISALGANSTDDFLGGQYRCHVADHLDR